MNDIKVKVKNLSLRYGTNLALNNISMDIPEKKVTAFIGPSGCGKSTFLRTLNRMNDLIDNVTIDGEVHIDDINIYDKNIDVVNLRKKVGMIFQKSNPFAKSVYDNIAFGPRINGISQKSILDEIVEHSLKQAAIWDEVKDRLFNSALSLSGGQQQRICIARSLAVNPEIILMDEPASALDPISTAKIEELIHELKKEYTIIIVTHNMQQAARTSDLTALFYMGDLVEMNRTEVIFSNPAKKQTEDYISGRFGLSERHPNLRFLFLIALVLDNGIPRWRSG
jgi:phosphate transport system ATP-binding protein